MNESVGKTVLFLSLATFVSIVISMFGVALMICGFVLLLILT